MKKENQWWLDFFEKDFRPFFNVLPTKGTGEEVRYVINKLKLKSGERVLDCPCGFGRISIPLAQKGLKVTGVDITPSYLDELQKKAVRKGLKIITLPADMRKIEFRNQFDAALNLGTSFGIFENDRDNLLALRKMFHALKPGGRFVMHVKNRDWIIVNFASRGWMQVGKAISFEKRKFDYAKSINRIEWNFMKNGETHTRQVALRMYSYHELIEMFKKVGFVNVVGFSSIKDEPIDRNKQYMWVFGSKPK